MNEKAISHDTAKRLLLTLSREYEALRKGNADNVLRLLSDNPRWHLPLELPRVQTSPGLCEGRESITALLKYVMKGFSAPPKWTFIRVIADENSAAVQFTGHCLTYQGKPYDNRYCMVQTFKDGLIDEVHEYLNVKIIEQAYAED